MEVFRIFVLLSVLANVKAASKVLELSDRFLELRGESTWLIMFYAPWCGHCKKLDPVWNHVAHALYGTDIRVGRVDCTRFTAVATEFVIKGFPTIMYVKGHIRHVYKGDRVKEEIIGFALRMSAPPIQHIQSSRHLKETVDRGDLFFIYVGNQEGDLWESYRALANEYRPFYYFYHIDATCMEEHVKLEYNPAVMVFKDEMQFFYPVPDEIDMAEDSNLLNTSLTDWINHERFTTFVKVTHGNVHQLWKINKFLAITVVKESKIGRITTDEDAFKDMVESVIRNSRDKYHKHFQFGWTGTPDLANSIAMERLPLPSLLVVNSTTMQHHLPEDPAQHLTPAAVEMFLDSIIAETAPSYGGDSWPIRVYRTYYNAKTSLEEMWQGNPVLTSVLFGLPMGFLSLICYSIWCSDILDADEEEEDHHEKKE
ncbi:protein disulfide-isomerase TMX3-like isoform X2 [Homarus americanus]|uniref:protein disulfide-isomerase TMX3-like isoform X2 n=1 Tax=Homarus americanus TaxID=6706 RepID=UPI001C446575|nr:protein disulfide-isomerase TMX3-like isoform X2 [Homarus americanus]